MRIVCYLQILLLTLYLSIIISPGYGGAIIKYGNAAMKNISMSTSLPFEDCGSKYLILYLKISSCNKIPCVMKRGTTAEVNVIFNDDSDSSTYLKHRVRWIFNGIKTHAHITPDPCDGIHKCLSNYYEGKFYHASVSVSNTLPAISGTMQWKAVNEWSEDVICFKMPVVVTV